MEIAKSAVTFDSIRIELDKIENRVREEIPEFGLSSDIRVQYDKHFKFSVNIESAGREIMDMSFDLCNVSNFDEFINQIITMLKKYFEESKTLSDKYKEIAAAIPITRKEFNFDNWITGKCKYANLGYTRYAYVGLNGFGIYTMWIRVFFNREGIIWDKTTGEIKPDREERSNQNPTGIPPDVQIIWGPYVEKAIPFLKGQEKELFTKLSALPLNKSDIKESTPITMCILVGHQEPNYKSLLAASDSDLCNPNAELYLYTAICDNNDGQRKIKGYCKKIEGSEDVFEVYSLSNKTSYAYDRVKSLDGTDKRIINRLYLGKKVTNLDEFVSYIIEDGLKEWRSKHE